MNLFLEIYHEDRDGCGCHTRDARSLSECRGTNGVQFFDHLGRKPTHFFVRKIFTTLDVMNVRSPLPKAYLEGTEAKWNGKDFEIDYSEKRDSHEFMG